MDKKKYQWSIKLDNGEIYVIQGDTWEELRKDREEAYKDIMGVEKPLESQPERAETITREPVKDVETPEDWCAIHDVKMFPKDGKFGKFYSHSEGEYPDKKYCNGKGFK